MGCVFDKSWKELNKSFYFLFGVIRTAFHSEVTRMPWTIMNFVENEKHKSTFKFKIYHTRNYELGHDR